MDPDFIRQGVDLAFEPIQDAVGLVIPCLEFLYRWHEPVLSGGNLRPPCLQMQPRLAYRPWLASTSVPCRSTVHERLRGWGA